MTANQQAVQVRAAIIFLFVLSVGVLAYGAFELSRGYRSQSWPRVPARILELCSLGSVGRGAQRTALTYEYHVDGALLHGHTACFGGIGSNSKEREKLDTLNVGGEVEISVDPHNPTQSVLYSGITSGALVVTGFGTFAVLFTGMVGLIARKYFRHD